MTTSKPKGIKWASQPLGRMRDSDLARNLGVTPESVRCARRVRGIPSLFPPGGSSKRGRGKGRNKAKRAASTKRWHDKRRAEGRPLRTPEERVRATTQQRERRRVAKALALANPCRTRNLLATWGVWSD